MDTLKGTVTTREIEQGCLISVCLFQGSNMVFISSYTAYHPEAPIAMYAISKTALVALTKALAEELGPDGIRVNCVAPGAVLPLTCRSGSAEEIPSDCIILRTADSIWRPFSW